MIKITTRQLLKFIIVVIALLAVIFVFYKPVEETFSKSRIEEDVRQAVTILPEDTSGSQSIIFVSSTDTDDEKIKKLFKYFNTNYIHRNVHAGTDFVNILYNKFTIDSTDYTSYSDINSAILTGIQEWSDDSEDYELICPDIIDQTRYNNLNPDTCWDTQFNDLEYDDDEDSLFQTLTCMIFIEHAGTGITGTKTIRVFWHARANNDIYEIYPIITVCGDV